MATSYVGSGVPIRVPSVSTSYDFEGELVAVVRKTGRYISEDDAHDHIVGYSIFNDGSIRDYQDRTTQWTLGKNFDQSGAFGPIFVTANEFEPGAKNLKLATKLNGQVVQDANTSDMLFNVATIVRSISEAITIEAGDVIATGTPGAVGGARTPKLFMKAGVVPSVSNDKIGVLENLVASEI